MIFLESPRKQLFNFPSHLDKIFSPRHNITSGPRMASTSSINSNSSGSQAPNPPPRTLSRPTQPPPPPPLPSVPPVPPTRDSSIGISAKAAINHHSSTSSSQQILLTSNVDTQNEAQLLSHFDHLFKPISELPPPEPFMNKSKSYPSQKSQQQKQSLSQKIQT